MWLRGKYGTIKERRKIIFNIESSDIIRILERHLCCLLIKASPFLPSERCWKRIPKTFVFEMQAFFCMQAIKSTPPLPHPTWCTYTSTFGSNLDGCCSCRTTYWGGVGGGGGSTIIGAMLCDFFTWSLHKSWLKTNVIQCKHLKMEWIDKKGAKRLTSSTLTF